MTEVGFFGAPAVCLPITEDTHPELRLCLLSEPDVGVICVAGL